MVFKIQSIIVLWLYVLWSTISDARPISYPDGVMLMQENNSDSNSFMLNYTPTAKYSVGYTAEYWRDNQWQFHGSQFNYLINRWNLAKSQANLYFESAVGIAYSDSGRFRHDIRPAGFTGLAFDWEDRDYFLSYSNRFVYAQDFQKISMQKARIGITPYVGDYGDLHTWFMVEFTHNPTAENPFMVTPMIRLFKDEYLGEFGISNKGDILLNWVTLF